MMDMEIPISAGDPNYIFSTILRSQLYYLSIRFNSSADLFTLGIFDAERNPIVTSLPLTIGIPIGYEFAGSLPKFPKGIFFLSGDTRKTPRADLDNFGNSLKLIFREVL